MKTLIGQKKGVSGLPPAATPAERSLWRTGISFASLVEDGFDEDDDGGSRSDDDPLDPDFPYINGPGIENAKPSVLKIMWRVMQQARVKSYRPNCAKPLNSPENMFLWELAAAAFVKLVMCGEYAGISPQEATYKNVLTRIKSYAKESLLRK